MATRENEPFWKLASGPKSESLKARAVELQSLSPDATQVMTVADSWEPRQARDFSSEPVQAMTAALLNAYIGRNAEGLHNQVFQLNCIQLEAPPGGGSVLTDARDRIWIASVKTLDFNGSIDSQTVACNMGS